MNLVCDFIQSTDGAYAEDMPCTESAEFSIVLEGGDPYAINYACAHHVGALLEAGTNIVTSLATTPQPAQRGEVDA